jgi:hypothetical protein
MDVHIKLQNSHKKPQKTSLYKNCYFVLLMFQVGSILQLYEIDNNINFSYVHIN